MEPTHASFFSGVGGLDLGLERAGWRTVSFSEIDPYASAVLAERWPGVPNLGDIVAAARTDVPPGRELDRERDEERASGRRQQVGASPGWQHATLWSGGFPCQDLSVAGKRAGFGIRPTSTTRSTETGERTGDAGNPGRGTAAGGTRSGLAFAFLALVERYRPPAILLENVPGLLSSHHGRDMAALVGLLGELGYGWAYRVLDAQHFGVPQRRRRVFIVALDARRGFGPDSAAEVLSVGSRCERHLAAGVEAGPGAAEGARPGVDIARAVTGTSGKRHDDDTDTLIGPAAYSGGNGAPDGLAGRLDDRGGVVQSLDTKRGGPDDNEAQAGHLILSPTLLAPTDGGRRDKVPVTTAGRVAVADSDLLPLGLDSHRYRCCGNGVVSSVSEWVGIRLLEAMKAAA